MVTLYERGTLFGLEFSRHGSPRHGSCIHEPPLYHFHINYFKTDGSLLNYFFSPVNQQFCTIFLKSMPLMGRPDGGFNSKDFDFAAVGCTK